MASKTRDSGVAAGATITTLTTETDLFGPDGFDVELMDRFEFGIKNTGAQSLTAKVYYQYVPGGSWFQDLGSGNAPTITAGSSGRLQFVNITARRVRVTATPAAATTTVVIEGHAAGYQ